MKAIHPLLFIVILVGCSDYDLKKSIFVDDPENPGLPVYSEWGYNTFGAYYDRTAFTSTDYETPFKVIVQDEKTSLSFKGRKEGDYSTAVIRFEFPGDPETYQDLLVLNDSTISLTNPVIKVYVSTETIETEVTVISGEIKFIRAQNLLVDKKQTEVILSGTFELQFTLSGEPISVTKGRFDVSVQENNFFLL